jgi:hypothetical protein
MVGNIIGVDCGASREVLVTLSLGALSMKLHAGDLSAVNFSGASGARQPRPIACAQLRGMFARVEYVLTSGQSYEGEIRSIAPAAQP